MKSSIKILLCLLFGLFFRPTTNFTDNYMAQAYEHSTETLKHLKTAKQYVDLGKYQEAKAELEAGLKLDPKSPDILNNLGSIFLRLSQKASDSAVRTNNLNNARVYFTQALSIDPDFSAAWNSLADVYYLGGDVHKAISYYKKALSLSPKHAFELQTNLANALRDSGLTTEAAQNYEKAIELNPLYAPAHNGYAELLYNQNELSQALSESTEAIRLKPDYATAYYHLGLIESARNNKENALKAYMLSLRYETNPSYAQSTQTLIDQLELDTKSISSQTLKQYQASLGQSLSQPQSSQITPPNNTPKQSGELQITVNANTTDKYKILSIKKMMVKQEWKKAQKEMAILIRMHPDDVVLLNDMAIVLINQKNYAAAEKLLNKALVNSHQQSAAAYFNLGQIHLSKHQIDQAQKYLRKAKSLSKSDYKLCALINNSLAIIFKEKGDLSEAENAYRDAIASGGNSYPVFHYNLALLLEQKNQKQAAISEYQQYLSLSRNGLNIRSARIHLEKLI